VRTPWLPAMYWRCLIKPETYIARRRWQTLHVACVWPSLPLELYHLVSSALPKVQLWHLSWLGISVTITIDFSEIKIKRIVCKFFKRRLQSCFISYSVYIYKHQLIKEKNMLGVLMTSQLDTYKSHYIDVISTYRHLWREVSIIRCRYLDFRWFDFIF
jgi:hypothetical protein